MVFDIVTQPLQEAVRRGPEGVLDGRAVADALLEQVQSATQQLARRGITPTLAVVRAGDDMASDIYVRHKERACARVGIAFRHEHLPATVREDEIVEVLSRLNADPNVHGILLQLPLPGEMNGADILTAIDPQKDVDGFHPLNLGGLMSGRAVLEPCTPRGVMTLLSSAGVELTGKRAVVIGRSVIVGRPMSLMLARANATVTLCHRHTRNLDRIVSEAEILVVATGVAGLVKGSWVREGAVVIDVGISRVEGKVRGDVEFEAARKQAALITPVPRGVGPMTVATLMENVVRAVCVRHGLVVRAGELVEAASVGVCFDKGVGLAPWRVRPISS
ncbi:bifunctional 5,10-methylene-tetrahydrofolate dehydrogenase/5,10-methylene-tetrahydrofolate cyclohydrolase [Lujinxingia litoralis]|uniref:Bifunctional protein FolD n=1 Tax=Lujinxingia litoralis TaxID=2211119 RepID=A0A328C8T4_9DELT|nr:bifunctional 5,10-methylenetetrahydrofolate dehydrogenase/5,10-methenyltetrahydrofolate cyclohydrolase [Lujinxingia litoralis]RAL23572.1 bifunctional 5,10-methylene-tetrahydrofolate dehydrogenase/5,10-methylene-tetrahydrofolate cyclohydrolase [Lujinxingia litoralis]